jgi:hypothetical protein
MSWDVVVFGSISIPERNQDEWLSALVDPVDFPWLDEVGGVDGPLRTPETMLGFLSDLSLPPHSFFDLSPSTGLVTVQAYLGEEPYRDVSQTVALLFASAASFGGTGELLTLGYQGIRFGEKVLLQSGLATFTQLGLQAMSEAEQSAAYQCLDARIHQRFDALVGRSEFPSDERHLGWMIHPFTGRRVRAATRGFSKGD